MKACLDCGTIITTNFSRCRSCYLALNDERNAPKGASVASAPVTEVSTPLDVACGHVTDYGPEEGTECPAGIGQPCTFSVFAPYLFMRVVNLGAAGILEVHESRFRKWKGQPVKLS